MYQGKVLEDGNMTNSPAFEKFAKDLKYVLLEELGKANMELKKYQVNYYGVSGFLRSGGGKYIYFSYNEPRYTQLDFYKNDCRNGFLIRVAKNDTDYGGIHSINHFCSLITFTEMAEWIFGNVKEFEHMETL